MPIRPRPCAVPGRRAGAVVDDLDAERVRRRSAGSRSRAVAPRVAQGVGERLLHDPVGGELERRRQLPLVADELELDLEAGGPHLVEQRVEPVEAGLG